MDPANCIHVGVSAGQRCPGCGTPVGEPAPAPAPAPKAWLVSTYSTSSPGDCVQVALGAPGAVPVRDSKWLDGPVLSVPPGAWRAFVADLRDAPCP